MEFGRKRMVGGAFAGIRGMKKPRNALLECSYGEACHFLHHVPGYSAMSQISNMGLNPAVPTRRHTVPFSDGPASTMKSKLCNKYNTAEGCRFGDKCHFAHSEMEIGKPVVTAYDDFQAAGPQSRFSGYHKPSQFSPAATEFGASATTTISIDAALARTIIGKNGVKSKQICRLTGVKLFIKDHEMDSNRKNIELQGTFDQINQASAMVREMISNIGCSMGDPKSTGPFKMKMCENFSKGSCTFGEKCHFAHSASELQKPLA